MITAMLEVGRLMEEGEYFIPEVLQSAKAMKRGMEIIEPILLESKTDESAGYVILGTVHGHIPDIGKNLVEVDYEKEFNKVFGFWDAFSGIFGF
jgi:5-methyltetrahydrofolate--homocysteine methyltransferase